MQGGDPKPVEVEASFIKASRLYLVVRLYVSLVAVHYTIRHSSSSNNSIICLFFFFFTRTLLFYCDRKMETVALGWSSWHGKLSEGIQEEANPTRHSPLRPRGFCVQSGESQRSLSTLNIWVWMRLFTSSILSPHLRLKFKTAIL